MKKRFAMYCAVACIALLFCVSGCTSKTEYGSCIGVADDKDPKLVYKVSVKNAVLGIIFMETIIVPIYVLVDETYCPVGRSEK
jgi:hypothetical protein